MFASVGLSEWEPDPPVGLVAWVGEDYPQDCLENFRQYGLGIRGVHVLPEAIDVCAFLAYQDRNTRSNVDSVALFAHLGLAYPKALLGYRNPSSALDSRTRSLLYPLRQDDIPPGFMDASAAYREVGSCCTCVEGSTRRDSPTIRRGGE